MGGEVDGGDGPVKSFTTSSGERGMSSSSSSHAKLPSRSLSLKKGCFGGGGGGSGWGGAVEVGVSGICEMREGSVVSSVSMETGESFANRSLTFFAERFFSLES